MGLFDNFNVNNLISGVIQGGTAIAAAEIQKSAIQNQTNAQKQVALDTLKVQQQVTQQQQIAQQQSQQQANLLNAAVLAKTGVGGMKTGTILAIVGGVILIGGIITFVVIRRKKAA